LVIGEIVSASADSDSKLRILDFTPKEHIISVMYEFMEVEGETFRRIKNLKFLIYVKPKNFDVKDEEQEQAAKLKLKVK
jgi:hypothetical protein